MRAVACHSLLYLTSGRARLQPFNVHELKEERVNFIRKVTANACQAKL